MHPPVDNMYQIWSIWLEQPVLLATGEISGIRENNTLPLVPGTVFDIFLCLTALPHLITPLIALQGHQTDIKNKTETM